MPSDNSKAGSSRDHRPPLPPRESEFSQHGQQPPPPYSPFGHTQPDSRDPRTSSTQSLLPEEPPEGQSRRRLLLVYIHGFQGNETSFQSFPAHVHNVVKITLAGTHTVHTKIYPKYRTRRNIEYARDDFSTWLAPHESPNTDIILLGHSMGGLLASEVILLQPQSPYGTHFFRHRIIGTINFDVPFLGMHPGVIAAGLSSIFRPGDKDESKPSEGENSDVPQRADTLYRKPADPYYNPSFGNDVNLPIRKGWENTMHFLNKHKHNLLKGSKQYVTSHLEFGGAMADYSGLKRRYQTVRPLEEEDETIRKSVTSGAQVPPRVRFINYYTASTGRPKKPRSLPENERPEERPGSSNSKHLAPASSQLSDSSSRGSRSRSRSPAISVEEYRHGTKIEKQVDIPGDELDDMQDLHPMPMTDTSDNESFVSASNKTAEEQAAELDLSALMAHLPPVPTLPQEPSTFDPSLYSDQDALEIAKKAHAREVRRYENLVEDRDSAIEDRLTYETKLRREAKQRIEDAERLKQDDAKRQQAEYNLKQQEADAEAKRQEEEAALPQDRESKQRRAEARQREAEARQREEEARSRDPNYQRPKSPEPDVQSILSQTTTLVDTPSLSTSTVNLVKTSTKDSAKSKAKPKSKPEKPEKPAKPPRDRKFCMLPPKDAQGGRDPTWVRVHMEGVDEVGAHCGLFFLSDTYEMLVGDVSARVEAWVGEEMTRMIVEGWAQQEG